MKNKPMKMTQRKNFSQSVMNIPIIFNISEGMFKKLKLKPNMSAYLRSLVLTDLNIDENGNQKK